MTFITLGGRSIFLIKLRLIIFRLSWFKDNNTVRLSLKEHKLSGTMHQEESRWQTNHGIYHCCNLLYFKIQSGLYTGLLFHV